MPLLYLNTRECRWYLMGEGEMKKIAAISLISIFIMSGRYLLGFDVGSSSVKASLVD